MKFQLHKPLSKQLRHALLRILQWNKQPSGMTIITSAPPGDYYVIPSGCLFHWRILALQVLPILVYSYTPAQVYQGWYWGVDKRHSLIGLYPSLWSRQVHNKVLINMSVVYGCNIYCMDYWFCLLHGLLFPTGFDLLILNGVTSVA